MSKYFKNNIFFYEDLKGDLNLNMRGSENGKITIASSKKRDMSEKFELIDTKFADGFKVCVSDKEQKGTPIATLIGKNLFIFSNEDLKEISKALSKVNKALDKEKQRLVLGSYVFYKQKIVGEVIDALASSNGKLAGLVTMPLKELVLSDDFSSFKRELKDQIACYKNECRDPEQPLITFYALNGRKVRSKLETWIPKLFAIES